jgi:hypothetical protein
MHGARNTPVPAPPHVTRGFRSYAILSLVAGFRRGNAPGVAALSRRAVAGGVGGPRRECDGRRLKMGRGVGMDPAGRWGDRPIPASAARDPDGGRKDACHWHRNGTTVPMTQAASCASARSAISRSTAGAPRIASIATCTSARHSGSVIQVPKWPHDLQMIRARSRS